MFTVCIFLHKNCMWPRCNRLKMILKLADCWRANNDVDDNDEFNKNLHHAKFQKKIEKAERICVENFTIQYKNSKFSDCKNKLHKIYSKNNDDDDGDGAMTLSVRYKSKFMQLSRNGKCRRICTEWIK